MFDVFGSKRREARRERERRAAILEREFETNAARSRLIEEIRNELGAHTNNQDKPLDQQFVCEKDLLGVWTTSRIEKLSAGLEWGEGIQARQHQLRVQKSFIKILSILVSMNWNDWTKFAQFFLYPTGWEDDKLPYDPQFLPQSNRSLFRTIQYMFIPIIIEEGEGPPYDRFLRMPFMGSEHLGTGSYGVVKKQLIAPGHLRHERRGRGTNDEPVWVACKVIAGSKAERPYGIAGTDQKPFISEHQNLQYLKSCLTKNENVMLSLATFTHGTDFVIISDLADLDLHKFLHGHGLATRSTRFTPMALLKEASNLCGALQFIHEGLRLSSRKISCAHLDLHPSNILVTWLQDDTNDPVGRWQLHDFGISRIKSPREAQYDPNGQLDAPKRSYSLEGRSVAATALAPGEFIKNNFSHTRSKRAPGAFMAPEIGFDDKAVDQESDMWSFGCILAVLLAFMVGGPDYVVAFQDARLNDSIPRRARTDYFYKPGEGDSHIVKPSVMKYLTALVKDPGQDGWILETVKLIFQMLQVDPKERQKTTAADVRESLEQLCSSYGLYLDRALGWTRSPVIEYTESLQTTATLFRASTPSIRPPPTIPRITESGVTSPRLSPPRAGSGISGIAPSGVSKNSSTSPQAVTNDEQSGFMAFETPKEPLKIAISPNGTHFAYVTKHRTVIHILSRDADWKSSKSLALKSVTMKPYIYTSAGAEFFQVSIAGCYAVIRSTTAWGAVVLHRLLCTNRDHNNWKLDNLPVYDLEVVASKIQEAVQVVVSCRGDLLLLWDDSLSLCNNQRLRKLVDFENSRIISASFSRDGLWIYCWAKHIHDYIEQYYIWDVLKGDLASSVPSRNSRALESPGYGRNIAIPCSNFFITSEKTYHLSSIGREGTEKPEELLPATIRDVVAGVSYRRNTGTNAENLVLVKHSESPASDSLFTISLSDYSMSTMGLKLSSHFLPDRDGIAITQKNGKVFAIVCHAEGLIEKVQVASERLITPTTPAKMENNLFNMDSVSPYNDMGQLKYFKQRPYYTNPGSSATSVPAQMPWREYNNNESLDSSATSVPAQMLRRKYNHNESLGSSDTTNENNITTPETTDRTFQINDLDSLNDEDDEFDLSEYEGEERIRNPRAYFRKIATLEAAVYQLSGIWVYGPSASKLHEAAKDEHRSCFSVSSVGIDGTLDEHRKDIQPQLIDKYGPVFRSLFECNDLLARVCKNLEHLQSNDFCNDTFSIIVRDSKRPSVANLRPIPISKVVGVHIKLRHVVDYLLSLGPGNDSLARPLILINSLLTEECLQSDCELLLDIILGQQRDLGVSTLELTFYVTQVLDLAVVSYVGAHIERFDQKFLGINTDERSCREMGQASVIGLPGFVIRRRRLTCLAKFLGGEQVWVFHLPDDRSDEALSLCTDIQTFGDIWGPLWRVANKATPDKIQQYNVGNGSIIPWSVTSTCPTCLLTRPSCDVQSNEIFCHWVSSKEWDPEHHAFHQLHQATYFTETVRLLIGAEAGFTLNKSCIPTTSDLLRVKTMFSEQHALRPLNVKAPRRFIDTDALQMQASVFTLVTIGGTKTYKRQSGTTMKDALVERWHNHLDRNPGDLEAFGGLEISLCTRNAVRTRLLDVLRSRTMKNYLKSVNFHWVPTELEEKYFLALKSRGSFRKFWNHCEHIERENAGNVISLCLDRLQYTGVDPDDRHLDVLWVEGFETVDFEEEEDDKTPSITGPCEPSLESLIVTLSRSDFTWTGLLKDSMESFSMAVMAIACLDYDDRKGYGRRCKTFATGSKLGYSVMKTALLLNRLILKDEGIQAEESQQSHITVWNVREVKKDTKFDLGDHGTLRVLQRLRDFSTLEVEWQACLSATKQEITNVVVNQMMIGRGVEKHHQEYIQGVCLNKPVPILVLSKNMVPGV